MEIVKLTTEAQVRAKTLLDREEEDLDGLRISVIGGGCSGLQYRLQLDSSKETDSVHGYDNGLQVMVDEKSSLYLLGSSLEYFDTLDRQGFEVINPNATATCGCGQSFN
jgi:iron-sulfur cluster assembly protein